MPVLKELGASADSTLSSSNPSNNYGSEGQLAVGRIVLTAPYTIVLMIECVLGFDTYAEIPPGSEVTSAQLILTFRNLLP